MVDLQPVCAMSLNVATATTPIYSIINSLEMTGDSVAVFVPSLISSFVADVVPDLIARDRFLFPLLFNSSH